MRQRIIGKRLRLQEAARAQRNSPEWQEGLSAARKALGSRVCALRQTKGCTQEEFARLSGLNRSYMGEIERGKNDLRISTIIRVARHLDLKASTLMKGIA